MRVVGTIVEQESGKPLAGLQVRAFDKDLIFHDKLGASITDATGSFRIDYSQLDFSSIFGTETVPELFIRVFDATGKKLLYTSEKAIRNNPQVEELLTRSYAEPDREKRIALYRQIRDLVVADCAQVELFSPFSALRMAMTKNVVGYQANDHYLNLNDTWIKT